MIPKVAAVHDISGVGRCSLTVIIPVLSSMGVQVCPLPTASLSSQTDGYQGYSFLDMTDSMAGHIAHWKRLGLRFDCVYSGFLGSARQIDIVRTLLRDLGEGALRLVDPVMGDNGCLYTSYRPDMVEQQRRLVESAGMITPNLTEACFLLGETYREDMSPGEIKSVLARLSGMGPRRVLITGVPARLADGSPALADYGYDAERGAYYRSTLARLPKSYPGTGDTYASVLLGRLLRGDTLPQAMAGAASFVHTAIKYTLSMNTPEREGILLEPLLPMLAGAPPQTEPVSVEMETL